MSDNSSIPFSGTVTLSGDQVLDIMLLSTTAYEYPSWTGVVLESSLFGELDYPLSIYCTRAEVALMKDFTLF